MQVNKFGGASIKDAKSIQYIAELISDNIKDGVIVVSALGKTTNKLELIVDNYINKRNSLSLFGSLKDEIFDLLIELFDSSHGIFDVVSKLFTKLNLKLQQSPSNSYDFEYDQIVSFGELISAPILAAQLIKIGVSIQYIDARLLIKTDSNYREGELNWDISTSKIQEAFSNGTNQLYLTQGFIASDSNNLAVTLGREGSDYTAAIIGNVLMADKVTVWKDVPGIMCADPNWMPGCDVLEKLSFHESIELSYYGAKVIHPKTIKPLQNKGIPLHVRSFIDIDLPGTTISKQEVVDIPPVYVRMQNQVLISIWQHNYSFIVEKNLGHIFNLFHKHRIKVNLMQNSAISFSVSVDGEMLRVKKAIQELKESYHVKYNDNLELISVRHFQPGIEEKLTQKREILLEQKSRSMARFVMKME